MLRINLLWDKTAIGLSLLCMIHCLALPLFLVIFPSISSLQLDNEAFHYWMVLGVLPISIYALTIGCKKHKSLQFLAVGSIGLLFLLLAILLHERLLGEFGEKIFTVIGTCLIAFSHLRNYQLCQREKKCECTDHQS